VQSFEWKSEYQRKIGGPVWSESLVQQPIDGFLTDRRGVWSHIR
jgi:hypothetical protein